MVSTEPLARVSHRLHGYRALTCSGDGRVTINEFDANLKDKTRKAIEEKLKAGFVFDKEK